MAELRGLEEEIARLQAFGRRAMAVVEEKTAEVMEQARARWPSRTGATANSFALVRTRKGQRHVFTITIGTPYATATRLPNGRLAIRALLLDELEKVQAQVAPRIQREASSWRS